jgi:hypothetical protein
VVLAFSRARSFQHFSLRNLLHFVVELVPSFALTMEFTRSQCVDLALVLKFIAEAGRTVSFGLWHIPIPHPNLLLTSRMSSDCTLDVDALKLRQNATIHTR